LAIIYIVEDNKEIRETLQDVMRAEKYEVYAFRSAEKAAVYLKKEEPDLFLLDLSLPKMDGFQFLKHIKKVNPKLPVIIITGHTDVSSAVKAMKLGADNYITKPFNVDEITLLVKKIVEAKHQEEHLAYLKEKKKPLGFEEIIGHCSKLKIVFEFIDRVSASDNTTVLIRGETGTGKELVARAIHDRSSRSQKPFIEVNCSAFQRSLLEAELFGYEPGAFTGALHRKKGLLELADQGTFFLDEIGDMEPELQAKILKVIEGQVFRRLGGTKEIQINTRVISATSRDLEQKISNNEFRQDLFYRLNVASITIPPLRQRDRDIISLAEHFLEQYNKEFKKKIKGFTKSAKEILLQYDWPGNVRELKNVIERVVLFEKKNVIDNDSLNISSKYTSSLPEKTNTTLDSDIPENGFSLADFEKQLISKALNRSNGNQSQAAKLLKISRETLRYRIKKHKIKRDRIIFH